LLYFAKRACLFLVLLFILRIPICAENGVENDVENVPRAAFWADGAVDAAAAYARHAAETLPGAAFWADGAVDAAAAYARYAAETLPGAAFWADGGVDAAAAYRA